MYNASQKKESSTLHITVLTIFFRKYFCVFQNETWQDRLLHTELDLSKICSCFL